MKVNPFVLNFKDTRPLAIDQSKSDHGALVSDELILNNSSKKIITLYNSKFTGINFVKHLFKVNNIGKVVLSK